MKEEGFYEGGHYWNRLGQKVFQVHGVHVHGKPVLKRRLSRAELVKVMVNLPLP